MNVDVVNRMKLLFIFILSLCFLILGSSMSRDGKVNVIVHVSPEQTENLFPELAHTEFKSMSQPSVFLRNLFLPGKQLDLLEDNGFGFHVSSKTLYGHNRQVLTAWVQMLHSQKFMRLLAARHDNGFYIYSLEKLII